MQLLCPGCMTRNFLQLWYSLLSLETKVRSPNRPWKIIYSDFRLTAQQGFRGSYLLAPWLELDLPHVQFEGIVETHNVGSQAFAIRGRLSLRICTEISCCPRLREYLSGWVGLVPGVLRVDASVLGLFGVLFTSYLDLWRASWSSLEVLIELLPEVLLLVPKSCVNNILQIPHSQVNLLHH
jgi:hypothetical protein